MTMRHPIEFDDFGFIDLFDLDEIQRIQDEFAIAMGVASIITQPDGTPITAPSNFTNLCSEIIRKTEKGCRNCFKSDAIIGRINPDGPIVQPCLSGGLWDAGASITIEGRHVANWLIGQVRDETQTEESMRAYAREIGADEEILLEAFREVPSMHRLRFEKIAQAFFTLANQLSAQAHQNFKLKRLIVERERIGKELCESESRFRRLFENSSDAILLIDSSGVFVDFNQAALDLLKMERGRLFFRRPSEISPEFQLDGRRSSEVEQEMLACAYSSGTQRFDWIHINAEGQEIIVAVCLMPITIKGETFLHVTWRDITERKRTEQTLRDTNERLERTNRELESFAYVAAHDLREPLRNITSFSSLLEKRLSGRLDGDEREFFQIVRDAGLRMDALVGALLNLSQVGRPENKMVVVSIAEVVKQALQDLHTRISETGAKVTIETPLPNVMGNSGELRRLFQNLISNAIKYGRINEPIRIAISCEADGEQWLFQVKDNGIGIETGQGYEELVFKLFQRLHQRNEYGGGTGIGLTICRKVVEHHGGRIWVVSDGLGKGATFHITLPKR